MTVVVDAIHNDICKLHVDECDVEVSTIVKIFSVLKA